jgi:CubicO group peptidase (beta-lactamase class C family)
LLRNLCGTAAAGIVVPQLCASRSVPVQEHNGSRAAMARIGRAFMEKYSVPGMSVSISRNGKSVYEHQWGMADKKDAQLVEPRSLFRIASVTKPITSVTIFTLIEKGRLTSTTRSSGRPACWERNTGRLPTGNMSPT